jgi:hypothetical protein
MSDHANVGGYGKVTSGLKKLVQCAQPLLSKEQYGGIGPKIN